MKLVFDSTNQLFSSITRIYLQRPQYYYREFAVGLVLFVSTDIFHSFFRWTEIHNLRFPRCFSTLFAMNDKLYIVGGAGKVSEKVTE